MSVSEYLKKDEILKRIYRIFVPLPIDDLSANFKDIAGVRLPYVIFDDEKYNIRGELIKLRENGVKYALADNIGHINIASEAGFELFGNAGLNINNTQALEEYKNLGFKDIILSPELKFAQVRDIGKSINSGIIAYGRISVMISENYLKSDIANKTGAKFIVAEDSGNRSIIYNSVPVYLADKRELYKNLGLFFISLNFTRESPGEIKKIIDEYIWQEKAELPERFTRGYK